MWFRCYRRQVLIISADWLPTCYRTVTKSRAHPGTRILPRYSSIILQVANQVKLARSKDTTHSPPLSVKSSQLRARVDANGLSRHPLHIHSTHARNREGRLRRQQRHRHLSLLRETNHEVRRSDHRPKISKQFVSLRLSSLLFSSSSLLIMSDTIILDVPGTSGTTFASFFGPHGRFGSDLFSSSGIVLAPGALQNLVVTSGKPLASSKVRS